jgi:5-methylcytosine-specific restriction protein A
MTAHEIRGAAKAPEGARAICPGPFRTLNEAKRHGVVFGVPRRHCRWCGVPVEGRRSSFCSGGVHVIKRGHMVKRGEGCVHEFKLRSDPNYLRREVFERDRGVCACCKANVPLLIDATRKLSFAEGRTMFKGEQWITRLGVLGALGFIGSECIGLGAWHADHIVPVERGGGLCGLDGMQTLCAPCHRRKSAKERSGT